MVLAALIKQRTRLALSISVLGALLISQQARAAEHIAPTPWSTITSSDISRLMPQGEIKPLQVGEQEFISLYREYMSAEQRGVVLIIPDWQHLPTNNDGINFLRTHLNDFGYTTIAMTVPDIDWQASAEQSTEEDDSETEIATAEQEGAAIEPSSEADKETVTEQTDASENAVTPKHVDALAYINDDVIDDYKENLVVRFEALYQSALDEGGKIVLIAQGASAGVLLEHYASFPNNNIDAFISLSSYLPNPERNQQLNTLVSTISPPLLDIFYSNDNPDLLLSVADRKRWVKRHSKYDYRQRELFGLRSEPQQHERLSKEIDGFLRRLF
ncbi:MULTISPECIES: DUF3530 family protein [unclassified Pseudoalteromonas]|uniref:DUF3530 family protein n=1 Tax=unclassified Pseudoalteromonas TaxID=194690 RepID=UPI0025B58D70|nr:MULTISPECIES: DUF3530 family protein [unclassified Pseudoalteromonas]MDN3378307.1 DUF3530 family protein [Pseudoalteromonas sp. APC 3893]MDN3386227.1 DUF3530 family protein [Pseudoalteromonas sp. APC 4017]